MVLLIESFLTGLGTLTLLVMARVLGQASDIVRGIATTPRQIVDLVLFSVASFLLSWALAREWWRMRTTSGHAVAPTRFDR